MFNVRDKGVLELVRRAFRENSELALRLREVIWRYFEKVVERHGLKRIKIMNFCGTHEWTVTHYGIRSLLPEGLELVAGPGCPVCIVPAYYIDVVLKLGAEGVRIYTYGDVVKLRSVRARAPPRSLEELKAFGGDVTVVYSFIDAVRMARERGGDSLFLGIGFETMAPSYALAFKRGIVPKNLKFLSLVRLTPPAMKYTIKVYRERGLLPIQGVIAPGHVSAVIGGGAWEFLPRDYGLPTVVAGFEPIDVLIAIAQILQMIYHESPRVIIEYRRVVSWDGNVYAKKAVDEVFVKAYSAWRGLGFIPRSGLKLRERYSEAYDALSYYGVPDLTPREFIFTHAHHGVPWEYDLPPRCRCGEVVLGIARPIDCPMFMKGCTPSKPWGPCMVSYEGTCNVWARSGVGQISDLKGVV